MAMLAEEVEGAVVPAEGVELNGDHMEAEAWAWLAVRALKRLPITWPTTTGVDRPRSGGVVTWPRFAPPMEKGV
jgi:anhydro-N-acetylmuramic acid kinase